MAIAFSPLGLLGVLIAAGALIYSIAENRRGKARLKKLDECARRALDLTDGYRANLRALLESLTGPAEYTICDGADGTCMVVRRCKGFTTLIKTFDDPDAGFNRREAEELIAHINE